MAFLLKQANMDSFRMAEAIGVSEEQLRLVTNTESVAVYKIQDLVVCVSLFYFVNVEI